MSDNDQDSGSKVFSIISSIVMTLCVIYSVYLNYSCNNGFTFPGFFGSLFFAIPYIVYRKFYLGC